MKYDYSCLRGKIREKGLTESDFARHIGINAATLSGRINNKSYFSQSEIWDACRILGIPIKNVYKYFFTPMLLNIEENVN